MSRVVVLDDLAQEGLDLLAAAPGIEYEVRIGLKGEALRQTLTEFDGAICRSGVKLTEEILAGNTRLKGIVRAGVGTDNIDKQAATRIGTVVMNTPAGNTLSTAEQTIALMMTLSRNIAPANQGLIEGRWDRKKYMGTQLAGKTLGVVGLGRIGLAVVSRAKALEMKILGYDPFMSAERAGELGIELVSTVEEMLPRLDYMTVHTPLTDETRNMIDLPQLDKIKPGIRLINCARGGIYNEAALVQGLESGVIAGVALDVYEAEPCTDSPLFGMKNVVCTPHLGASTEEAQTSVAVEAVTLLTDFLTNGTIRHSVNVAPLDKETLDSLGGYLGVAYRLGLLVADLQSCGICRTRVTYRGEIAEKKTKILTSVFAAGLLQGAMDEEVNIINAELLLKERGIELVEESVHEMGAFRSSMTVRVEGEHPLEVTGTIFGQNMPRLVAIDGFRLEAFLDGSLLVFRHHDVPGIIGTVGTILGQHKINIAQMAVGRNQAGQGGNAIGILNLDDSPTEKLLVELQEHPSIDCAKIANLPDAKGLPAWLQN